jgi:acyl carrier protein
MLIRETVYQTITTVAAEQRKPIPSLNDDLKLSDSGLDSLCLAILIARLDDHLNVNPFNTDNVDIPISLGDLVRIYEQARA